PVMTLALSSDIYDRPSMYDIVDSILAQKIAQIKGVGQVRTWGSSRPAVRVQVNPTVLHRLGLSLVDVATTLQQANAHQAKGDLSNESDRWQINATDQIFRA